MAIRDDRWSEAIAVGSLAFVENVKNHLGVKATHRIVTEAEGSYALRDPAEAYGAKSTDEIEALRTQTSIFWDETVAEAKA